MFDSAHYLRFPTLLSALTILLGGIMSAACGGQTQGIETTVPLPTPTPTLNFAVLPQILAAGPSDETATPIPIVTATPPRVLDTPTPDTTRTLNLLPATPDTSWTACPGAPPSHLRVGDRAAISYEPYLPTRVRTRPGQQVSSILGLIIPGEVVEIVEGPACADQAVWWKITSLRKNLEGWVQEGDDERSWLIRADPEASARVPPPTAAPCPVADDKLCTFIDGLKEPIAQGDFVKILANTRIVDCPAETSEPVPDPTPPEEEISRCTNWGVIGSGLGGLDLTPLALIEPGWLTYAPPPRTMTGLILPPYEGIDTSLPESPGLFIRTRDPLWDWIFIIEAVEGDWQISAMMMISKNSDAYPIFREDLILWPN